MRVLLGAGSIALLILPLATALFGTTTELLNFAPTFVYVIVAIAIAIALALYSYWALASMAVYGRETWTRGGEGFAVAFGLLARIAPFAVRDGAIIVRWPLTGLAGAEPVRGALVFVAVMLGSTSFDGFTRTREWQDLLGNVRARFADDSQRVLDLATTAVNIAGLAAFVGFVVVTYLAAAVSVRRLVRAPRSLAPDFILPLVPIALLSHG